MTEIEDWTATLLAAWRQNCGASAGCGRILHAVDTAYASGRTIAFDDVFRPDYRNKVAALNLICQRLLLRFDQLPLVENDRMALREQYGDS